MKLKCPDCKGTGKYVECHAFMYSCYEFGDTCFCGTGTAVDCKCDYADRWDRSTMACDMVNMIRLPRSSELSSHSRDLWLANMMEYFNYACGRRYMPGVFWANYNTDLDTACSICTDYGSFYQTYIKNRRADDRSDLMRCVFGNPFDPFQIDERWLTSTVLDLAALINRQEEFDRMPILADALMDAGCDNDRILKHCNAKVHDRYCAVLALILKMNMEA